MPTAIDKLKEEFIHIEELCNFLGITKRRCQDLISMHKNDGSFMRAYKAAAGVYYFHIDDVRAYLKGRVCSSETCEENEEVD